MSKNYNKPINYNIVDDNIIELNIDDLIEYNKYLDEELKKINMANLEIKERINKEQLHNKKMESLDLQIQIEIEKQRILREKLEREKERILREKEEKEDNNKIKIKNKLNKKIII
jgi:hypothetical protein